MIFRSHVFSSFRNSLRVSCWVSVLAPASRRLITSSAAVITMREMLMPKWRSKPASSAEMIACRNVGEMSSYFTTTRRSVANSPITWPLAAWTRVIVFGV